VDQLKQAAIELADIATRIRDRLASNGSLEERRELNIDMGPDIKRAAELRYKLMAWAEVNLSPEVVAKFRATWGHIENAVDLWRRSLEFDEQVQITMLGIEEQIGPELDDKDGEP
jgi:hypothetical protein